MFLTNIPSGWSSWTKWEYNVRLADGQPYYGHSVWDSKCVEMTRYSRTPNYTVNYLVGITGVKYVNILDGPSDTTQYVDFVGEAVNSFTDDGERAIQVGDVLAVDNAPIHHHAAERILRNWLSTIGAEYLFLPTYSPDLNPAVQCFRKVKTFLKNDWYKVRISDNFKMAVIKHSGKTLFLTKCLLRN